MRRVVGALFLTGLLVTSNAMATQTSRDDLVSACQKEAKSGNALAWKMEPSLRNVIEDHRKKMSAACMAFVTGTNSSTAALSQCLHETSAGTLHIQRDRNMDRPHLARQRDLCRALGAQTKQGPAPVQ